MVHPGRENGTWKGMDCLEIREFKELFHIKLNEKDVADIFKNNFGFDFFFFAKGREFSKLSSSAWFSVAAVAQKSQHRL